LASVLMQCQHGRPATHRRLATWSQQPGIDALIRLDCVAYQRAGMIAQVARAAECCRQWHALGETAKPSENCVA
jgi:hypothetical protein